MPSLSRPKFLLIISAVLVALVFVLSLIFFDVIPLNFFKGGATRNVTPVANEELDLACPLEAENCAKGEWVKVPDPEKEIIVSVWKNLPNLTPVFAIASADKHTIGNFPTDDGTDAPFLTIENREKNLEINYRLIGTLSLPPDETNSEGDLVSGIKKAEQIANIGEGGGLTVGETSGVALMVSIRDRTTGEYKEVDWKEFK